MTRHTCYRTMTGYLPEKIKFIDQEDCMNEDDYEDDYLPEDFIPGEEEESTEEDVDLYDLLFEELKNIIGNAESISHGLSCWLAGDRLRRTLSVIKDPENGHKAFKVLQGQIAEKFGEQWTEEKIHECIKLADEFPDITLFEEILSELSLKHMIAIMHIDSDLARTFYAEMSRQEKWSVEKLQEEIDNKLFTKEYGEEA
jgi:hypothetical protein